MTRPVITAFDWVPDFARGQVRDLRVRWILEEAGQAYDVRYLSQGAQKGAEHRARQPFGQVPTYQDGDLTLFESGAILLHVAERHGVLLPADPAGRARATEWLFAALNTVEPPIMDHAIATLFERDRPWSRPRLPAIEARIAERFGEVAARLGEREWYDGAFSIGDLMMVAVLRIMADSAQLAAHPTLVAYVERGTARPAFRRAIAAQLAGFTGALPAGYAQWAARGDCT
ncbi:MULTISPECIES: glutathione S-transferase family protein [unclassified Sphingomonas]|uniref:glutathione S-transferase family protein n=1 Tax=unclassified Sphingomonas TaxID=196159 RepID=UPI0006F7B167|nr:MULTISPECIES: glutathione S-transferase family protein [unclassified Sphingomonas]KQM61691.1 glutathione S-transferase [Sphingomonas sp. Leaf16]KQN12964.1 glutathione S-transferase [Sphingomonas sp. Leaf29]KQN19851.1 glutathione S-transferase [Sphingomonas sp. Leaf32]